MNCNKESFSRMIENYDNEVKKVIGENIGLSDSENFDKNENLENHWEEMKVLGQELSLLEQSSKMEDLQRIKIIIEKLNKILELIEQDLKI